MKSFFILLLVPFYFQSFSQTVINDEHAQRRDVSAFSGIKVSGGIDVYLSQSNDYALAVGASEDKYRDNIRTEVRNGVLIIYPDNNRLRFNNQKLRAYVSFKDLKSLDASGACQFIINGSLQTNNMKIKLSGASGLKGNMKIDNLQVDLAGASTMKADGKIGNLKIDASGASDLKNYELVVDRCVAELSGASDVRITVNESISAKASGASSFSYKGNPSKTEVNTSGASSISKKN